MKYTTNLNLKKPDYIELADIGDMNANMDILDDALTAHKSETASTSAKGHVQLSTSTTSTSTSTAATSSAVKAVNDALTAHKSDTSSHITSTERATWNAKQAALGYVPVQQGGGTGQLGNKVYIGWDGSKLKAQVDALDLGRLLTESDYNQLFQYANDGKTGIANAVTAKGVSASPSDTFATLAGKIGQISTGPTLVTGNAEIYTDGNYTINSDGINYLPFNNGYRINYNGVIRIEMSISADSTTKNSVNIIKNGLVVDSFSTPYVDNGDYAMLDTDVSVAAGDVIQITAKRPSSGYAGSITMSAIHFFVGDIGIVTKL